MCIRDSIRGQPVREVHHGVYFGACAEPDAFVHLGLRVAVGCGEMCIRDRIYNSRKITSFGKEIVLEDTSSEPWEHTWISFK